MRSGSASTFVGKGRRVTVASVVAIVALAVSSLAGASVANASTPSGPGVAKPTAFAKHYPAGTYIVQLKNEPVSTYAGGVHGYDATKPAKGHQLNAHSSASVAYSGHLASTQSTLASKYGVKALTKYTVAYNGFAAKLTADQATKLAADSSVQSISKDVKLKVQDDNLTSDGSLSYLKVQGSDGLWNSIGGHDNAGKGIVVGDVDTGVAPENPAFAGGALETGTTSSPASDASTEPWYNSTTGQIDYLKSDGGTFKSTELTTGDNWSASDYNEKLIGGQFFDSGFKASLPTGVTLASSPDEYESPRDADGHGSHTASTAAGDFGNDASIDGTDYGTISGVAPAAKIAMYKACWTASVADDTGCDEVDLLSAINAAVNDGVDVINFSIGGDGGADTTYSPTDQAFLNAAAAGIFVSAAAGNSGPDASTLDNAAPWETTVAASSIPSFSATATLGDGKSFTGASITVNGSVNQEEGTPDSQVITNARLVLASAYAVKGKSKTNVNGCNTGALKTLPANTVVVCDREGIIDRTTKSQTVADAGGVGMILVNTIPEDVDADAHSVPTVHLDYSARATVRAYAAHKGATVSFTPATDESAVPQVAGFSSRGPVLAAGSDILKPDIAAPGVSILAAVASVKTGSTWTPKYGLDSGTSMATPHIAGFAALYLGLHPNASPASIKSAIMTSATDTVSSKNVAVTDPFVQGAGEVDPSAYLNPGLVYDSGLADWKAYIQGTGQADLSVTPKDPSDLNYPSIAVGGLTQTQTVTRTVTAVAGGHYTASITGLTGITATVSPSEFDISTGGTQTFTVTFARTTASLNKYATGFLTWTETGGTTVRSPIAVQPLVAPKLVTGTGTNGHLTIPSAYGVKRGTTLHTYGLAQVTTLDTGTATVDDAGEPFIYQPISVSGATYAQFSNTVTSGADSDTSFELDVYYYKKASSDLNKYSKLIGYTYNGAATQTVTVNKPKSGSYLLISFPATLDGSVSFKQTTTLVKSSGLGHLSVTPKKTPTAPGTVQAQWGGLAPSGSFLGLVRYGSGSAYTVLSVTSSPATAPENYVAPKISGTYKVGKKLTGTAGTWNIATKYFTSFSYQWYDNGNPITGATKSTYTLKAADGPGPITLQTTAYSGTLHTTATSNALSAP